MPSPFDDQVLSIPCPKCGKKTPAKVSQLKVQRQITCSSCRSRIQVKGLAEKLLPAEKSISSLGETIKKLSKRP